MNWQVLQFLGEGARNTELVGLAAAASHNPATTVRRINCLAPCMVGATIDPQHVWDVPSAFESPPVGQRQLQSVASAMQAPIRGGKK